jgi:uncharacterized membrane protein YccF (DUF307 family)
MNVRPEGVPPQTSTLLLAGGLVAGLGLLTVGLVWIAPSLAVPLGTASAVVATALSVAQWLRQRPATSEVPGPQKE